MRAASTSPRQGVYQSPRIFIDGFANALWVAVGFSAVGALAALVMPRRRRASEAPTAGQPALALGSEAA
jgi:hypothetical protein